MTLFDDIHSSSTQPMRQAELSFSYLNTTGRQAFRVVRSTLEEWFSHYPDGDKNDLRNRFRGRVEHNHQSSFFELFLHELLLCMGCSVHVHPEVPNSGDKPDFYATDPDGRSFYLEAAVVMEYSEKQRAAKARVAEVKDAIDDTVSPDFFVDYEFVGSLTSAPPVSKLKRRLEHWLSTLDHGEIEKLHTSGQRSLLPEFSFGHGSWHVVCTPRPKNKKRGRVDVRSGGLGPFEGGFSSVSSDLRSTLETKAKKYGELDAPLVIAVNVLEGGLDGEDVLNSLLGDEQTEIILLDGRVQQATPSRKLNGLWTSKGGSRNSKVNAVLVAHSIQPWYIPRPALRLYHNPYIPTKLETVLSKLPQASPVEGRMVLEEGELARTLLGLTEDWPGFDKE